MKNTFKTLAFLITLLAYGSNSGFSQNYKIDTINLDEVVVTASKELHNTKFVTQKTDIIPKQEISMNFTGNNNLCELLQTKPGISVRALSRNDANWGTYAGAGPKYSTYMLEGIPLDAFVDPLSLDAMMIEKIEIQRGVSSVLYPGYLSQDFAGNQSPLTGTVNLILKDGITNRETQALASFGSYNTLNTQLYHQDFNKNLNYYGGLNYEISDYKDYGIENSWLNMHKSPEYNKIKTFAGLNLDYGKNKLKLFFNHTCHNGDAGRIYRQFSHNYSTVNFSQLTEVSSNFSLNLSGGIRIYDRNWQESKYNNIDTLISDNGAYQKIIPLDLHGRFVIGKNSLIFGLDYQNASYHTFSKPAGSSAELGNKSRANQTGIYIHNEFSSGPFTVRGGLRYNTILTKIDLISAGNPGEPEKDYNSLIWNAGFKYRITQNFSLYGNAGNSFISPGLKSIGGTIKLSDKGINGKNGQLPNPDLKPENGLGLDLGTEIVIVNKFNLGIRGFRYIIDDAIIENRISESPSQSQSVNAGKSNSSGIEAEIKYNFISGSGIFVNYTFIKTNIENQLDSDQNGSEIPFAPSSIVNGGFYFNTSKGFNLSSSINYTGTFYDSSSKSGRKEFKPGITANLFASQKVLDLPNSELELFTKIYNISNNKFEMPWQFRNTGFSITFGIKSVFK
jgi:iron complex outermembrane recepter protein